jgi:hypothetical protein
MGRATPTPTVEALLDALVGRPDTTAAELAKAVGIGRSTTSKLLPPWPPKAASCADPAAISEAGAPPTTGP